jgi:hypothetical protein
MLRFQERRQHRRLRQTYQAEPLEVRTLLAGTGNLPPELSEIEDTTLSGAEVLIGLSGSDPNSGDQLTYSVDVNSDVEQLRAQHGVRAFHAPSTNWGGQGEKWFWAPQAARNWLYVLPDGRVFEWNGGGVKTDSTADEYVSQLSPTVHQNHELLGSGVNAESYMADVAIVVGDSGPELRIIRASHQISGNATVTVRLEDQDGAADQVSFNLEVLAANQRPSSEISHVAIGYETGEILQLAVSDAEADTLTYELAADSEAAILSQQFSVAVYHRSSDNWGGLNEKWYYASGAERNWLYLLPNGELHEWVSGSRVLAANESSRRADLGELFYETPELFTPLAESVRSRFDSKAVWESENWSGVLNERWIYSPDAANRWLYILPDGSLYEWTEGTRALAPTSDNRVALMGPAFYDNPELLIAAGHAADGLARFSLEAENGVVSVAVDGVAEGFQGRFLVSVRSDDGLLATTSESYVEVMSIQRQSQYDTEGNLLTQDIHTPTRRIFTEVSAEAGTTNLVFENGTLIYEEQMTSGGNLKQVTRDQSGALVVSTFAPDLVSGDVIWFTDYASDPVTPVAFRGFLESQRTIQEDGSYSAWAVDGETTFASYRSANADYAESVTPADPVEVNGQSVPVNIIHRTEQINDGSVTFRQTGYRQVGDDARIRISTVTEFIDGTRLRETFSEGVHEQQTLNSNGQVMSVQVDESGTEPTRIMISYAYHADGSLHTTTSDLFTGEQLDFLSARTILENRSDGIETRSLTRYTADGRSATQLFVNGTLASETTYLEDGTYRVRSSRAMEPLDSEWIGRVRDSFGFPLVPFASRVDEVATLDRTWKLSGSSESQLVNELATLDDGSQFHRVLEWTADGRVAGEVRRELDSGGNLVIEAQREGAGLLAKPLVVVTNNNGVFERIEYQYESGSSQPSGHFETTLQANGDLDRIGYVDGKISSQESFRYLDTGHTQFARITYKVPGETDVNNDDLTFQFFVDGEFYTGSTTIPGGFESTNRLSDGTIQSDVTVGGVLIRRTEQRPDGTYYRLWRTVSKLAAFSLVPIYDTFEEVRTESLVLWRKISMNATTTDGEIVSATYETDNQIENLKNAYSLSINEVRDGITNAFNNPPGVSAGDVWDALQGIETDFISDAAEWSQARILDPLTELGAVSTPLEFFERQFTWISEEAGDLFDGLKDLRLPQLNIDSEFFTASFASLGDMRDQFLGGAYSALDDVRSTFLDPIAGVFDFSFEAPDFDVNSIFEFDRNDFAGLSDVFDLNGLTDIKWNGSIGNLFSGISNSLVGDLLKGLWNGIEDAWKWVWGQIYHNDPPPPIPGPIQYTPLTTTPGTVIDVGGMQLQLDFTPPAGSGLQFMGGDLRARQAVEAAARTLSILITNELRETAGATFDTVDVWNSTPSSTVPAQIPGTTVAGSGARNVIYVQVGSRNINAQTHTGAMALAHAGYAGAANSGTVNPQWYARSGAQTALNIGTILGFAAFDQDTDNDGQADSLQTLNNFWHFDHTVPVEGQKIDLYSVALHELTHVLGIASPLGANSWDSLVNGTTYTGTNAQNVTGPNGNLIVPNLHVDNGELTGHFAQGIMSRSLADNQFRNIVTQPILSAGVRSYITEFDVAALQDVGWVIPGLSTLQASLSADDLRFLQSLGWFSTTAAAPTKAPGTQNLVFQWGSVPGNVWYSVLVQDSVYSNVFRVDGLNDAEYTHTVPLTAGTYRVWVSVVNLDDGFVTWSAPTNFNIAAVDVSTDDDGELFIPDLQPEVGVALSNLDADCDTSEATADQGPVDDRQQRVSAGSAPLWTAVTPAAERHQSDVGRDRIRHAHSRAGEKVSQVASGDEVDSVMALFASGSLPLWGSGGVERTVDN